MISSDIQSSQSLIDADVALVARACAGDQAAVIELMSPLQRPLHNLARRMVWHPEDAEDLVQEALLRLLTHLSSYHGEARFATWAYRVALNTMLNTRRRRMEKSSISFDEFGDHIERALAPSSVHDHIDPNQALLVEEVKLGCMTGMLLCLDRPARLAYILGEIFDIDSVVAASLCDVSPAAFRQRLSRARKALHGFVQTRCGLVSRQAACRCERMVGPMVASGMVKPEALLFADAKNVGRRPDVKWLRAAVNDLDGAARAVELFRDHPTYEPAHQFEAWLQDLLTRKPLADILASSGKG